MRKPFDNDPSDLQIQVENAMESALAASPPKDTINVLGAMPLDVPGMNQSARKMKVRGPRSDAQFVS